jgi:hypothetical protein
VQDVVRTNLACDDTAFNCVIQTEDEEGMMGVRLNKDIVQVCGCVFFFTLRGGSKLWVSDFGFRVLC